MGFISSLRRLLRHHDFRRLFTIRALTQTADGTLQIGMASHVLFNPASQPTAWSIAAMFAVTLMPFSIVGPFVSGLLDRWSRRNVAVVVDLTRTVLALAIAAMVAFGTGQTWLTTALFLCLMVALALNRFTLAGLAAGMQHTIDDDEFLTASALMPMIGPLGVLVGGGLAAGIRLASPWSADVADAVIFCCAAAMWALSASVGLRMSRGSLGPLVPARTATAREVLDGLAGAGRHLVERRPALVGLATITTQRVLYGFTLVTAMLLFRKHFHGPTEVESAMADIGLWMGASGVGFAMSVLLVPPLARRLGMRRTIIVLLVASAVVQLGPGQVLSRWPLVGASFLLGWFAQSLKICIDTVVQAHVDDEWKGRVFVIYDGLFNAAIVLAAVIAAVVLPEDAASLLALTVLGVAYLMLAACFWAATRASHAEFIRGTDLTM